MQFLDVRTIVAITGVMACLMALVLHFQRRSYPASIQGLDHWTAAPLLAFCSTVFFGLRGFIPDALSITAGNTLLFLAVGLQLSGTSRFFGQPLPRPFFPALLATSLLALSWVGSHPGRYADRVVFVCLVLCALYVWHALLIWRQPVQSFASRFTFTVLVLLTIVAFTRAMTTLYAPPTGLFDRSPLQMTYLVSLSFGLLLLTIGSVLMASERVRRELQELVTQDSLTGALTRRALFEMGESELLRSRRNGTPLSVLMLDLDHFKAINDQHGHGVGDRVIMDFVERAHTQLRRPSILGRYGGEEFVAVLPDTDSSQAVSVAERIRSSTTLQADLPHCQVSIGVATTSPQAADETLAALIDRADAGLYRAKELGRNRVELSQ
jgi:diguanylate cyclase (GGDEF)-like protein